MLNSREAFLLHIGQVSDVTCDHPRAALSKKNSARSKAIVVFHIGSEAIVYF